MTVAGCIGGGHSFFVGQQRSWSLRMGERPSQTFGLFMSFVFYSLMCDWRLNMDKAVVAWEGGELHVVSQANSSMIQWDSQAHVDM